MSARTSPASGWFLESKSSACRSGGRDVGREIPLVASAPSRARYKVVAVSTFRSTVGLVSRVSWARRRALPSPGEIAADGQGGDEQKQCSRTGELSSHVPFFNPVLVRSPSYSLVTTSNNRIWRRKS